MVDVVFRGQLYRTDLSVGGGPVEPPEGGESPPGIWGGGNEGFPTFPIVIPPDFLGPGVPAHPIVLPPLPPSIWPGRPSHPIVLPPDLDIWPGGRPSHPIVIPPPTAIWPGGRPTHPIVLPDDPEQPPEELPKWEVKAFWTEQGGWGIAIVPTEAHPGVPVPSKAAE